MDMGMRGLPQCEACCAPLQNDIWKAKEKQIEKGQLKAGPWHGRLRTNTNTNTDNVDIV